jgi:hypothetical protein
MLKLFRSKNPLEPKKPAFDIRESTLCAELGVSLDELRRRRQFFRLTQGVHFEYVKKRVLLSSVGALVLRGTISFTVPPDFKENAPTGDSERKPGPVAGLLLEKNPPPVAFTGKLIAWAMPTHNRRILIAYLPGTEPSDPLSLVTVMVRTNANFLRNMELPGPGRVLNQLRQDCYELQGECPRYRGRW